MVGIVTGSILGATMGIWAISQMNPREQRRLLKKKRRMNNAIGSIMHGMNMF